MFFRQKHEANAPAPIDVTVSGMRILSSKYTSAKASSAIAVTGQPSIVSGITISPLN